MNSIHSACEAIFKKIFQELFSPSFLIFKLHEHCWEGKKKTFFHYYAPDPVFGNQLCEIVKNYEICWCFACLVMYVIRLMLCFVILGLENHQESSMMKITIVTWNRPPLISLGSLFFFQKLWKFEDIPFFLHYTPSKVKQQFFNQNSSLMMNDDQGGKTVWWETR